MITVAFGLGFVVGTFFGVWALYAPMRDWRRLALDLKGTLQREATR